MHWVALWLADCFLLHLQYPFALFALSPSKTTVYCTYEWEKVNIVHQLHFPGRHSIQQLSAPSLTSLTSKQHCQYSYLLAFLTSAVFIFHACCNHIKSFQNTFSCRVFLCKRYAASGSRWTQNPSGIQHQSLLLLQQDYKIKICNGIFPTQCRKMRQ